jgi:elongin-A
MEIFKPPDIHIKEENHKSSPETSIKESNHKKSSSSSSHSSKSKSKSDNHHSSRNHESKSSERKEEPRKSSSSSSKHSSSSKSSDKSKHRHESHHSSSSQSESSSSSKRKHEESSKENETLHKKPKLEIKTEIKKESSKSSSSSSSKQKEKSKKKVEVSQDEMDGSGGMGFAEALALFDMPSTSSKKKEVPLADKITKTTSTSKSSSSSTGSKSKETFKKPTKSLTTPPKLLVQKPKLEPLPDIVNDLPSDVSIPEYRPAPLNAAVKDYINSSVLGSQYMRPQPRNQSDAELLTESFSSKANRTRVFSGNRVQKSVPSLFEMCIRILQENIDFLTETGGVPFDILRPVLERAKPEQLALIEYYNSYLLDESDVLWEPHCKRKFRIRQREEMETWREMYERCTREDEEKLSRLTRNIKQQQEKADGVVQKTMMAFVDTVAKAPRNIRHKQEIFGTNHKLVVSPAMRTVGLRNLQPNMAAAGDARLRVAAGLRDDAQQSK